MRSTFYHFLSVLLVFGATARGECNRTLTGRTLNDCPMTEVDCSKSEIDLTFDTMLYENPSKPFYTRGYSINGGPDIKDSLRTVTVTSVEE
jgi:hypothetical protein